MSTSTSRIARGTVLVAAGALALGLLPGIASAAPGPTPKFSYIDCADNAADCDQVLWTNDAAGTSGSAVALTPTADHYQTYSYDVSDSGDTWVVGLRHGPVNDDSYDSTTGLVLTHRGTNVGGKVTSRVLATSWDATPVISANGRLVWWLSDGSLYRFTVSSFDETTGAIAGVTLKLPAPLFVGTALEIPWNLAISPDGRSAAVLFHNDTYSSATPPVITGHKDRVLAAKIATPAGTSGAYFEQKYDTATSTKIPSANTFEFGADGTTLLYDESAFGDATAPHGVTASIPSAGPHTTTVAVTNALGSFYDARLLGSDIWAWQDSGVSPSVTSTLGTTTDPAVAPTVQAPRSDGSHTYRYVPSTTLPAPMVVASNRAAAHPHLVLSARSVTHGGRPAFWGYNLYLQPTLGSTYVEGNADEVDRGFLRWQVVGDGTVHSLATSGSTAFQKGLATYLGYLPPLTRNTYVWWSYAGDYLTVSGSTGKLLVTVVPKISVHLTRSSKGSTIFGGTTRRGGAVILYRVNGTKQTKVASSRINAVGGYTFGARRLAKGTYRVVAVADKNWASARSITIKV